MNRIIIAIIAILAFHMSNGQTGEKNFIDQNYIEVTGKAELELVPDMIYVKISISEKDNKGKESMEQLEKSMIKKLKDIGVDTQKDLAVLDFTSNFKSYLLKRTDIFTTKEYQVIARSGKTVSLIFMELEKLNISNISIEKLDHSEIIKHRQEVKIAAIKAAKEKAEAMTAAIGLKAGKALYIQEIEDYYAPPRPMMKTANFEMRVMDITSPELPEIDFEKIKLEARVIARFAIE